MPDSGARIGVLFVCMGNICRSPMAEGVFRRHVANAGLDDRFIIDSAGTTDFHVGDPPDPRAARTALENGLDISRQRARQILGDDLAAFTYLLAMDRDNLLHIERLAREAPAGAGGAPRLSGAPERISLLLSHADGAGREDVPDPYYGGERGFQDCFELIEAGAAGLFKALVNAHFPGHDR